MTSIVFCEHGGPGLCEACKKEREEYWKFLSDGDLEDILRGPDGNNSTVRTLVAEIRKIRRAFQPQKLSWDHIDPVDIWKIK